MVTLKLANDQFCTIIKDKFIEAPSIDDVLKTPTFKQIFKVLYRIKCLEKYPWSSTLRKENNGDLAIFGSS